MPRGGALKWVALMLCATLGTGLAAGEPDLGDDGWYFWEVPAGGGGTSACCYEFRGGAVTGAAGCRLSHGENDLWPMADCDDVRSATLRIYVEMKNGRAREIRSLSSHCPVQVDPGVRTIDGVSTADSIAWLLRQVRQVSPAADEAIMSVSLHAESDALPALIALVEDGDQHQEVREEALFWLVQTESDAAFAYLDRLLD